MNLNSPTSDILSENQVLEEAFRLMEIHLNQALRLECEDLVAESIGSLTTPSETPLMSEEDLFSYVVQYVSL